MTVCGGAFFHPHVAVAGFITLRPPFSAVYRPLIGGSLTAVVNHIGTPVEFHLADQFPRVHAKAWLIALRPVLRFPHQVIKTDGTRLSEMHYVYISKPFPQPAPKPAPAPQALPPLQDEAPVSQDSDWRQAPEGDLSDRALPGAEEQTPSLKARFLQALQEQKEDYQQGKIPEPPDD